MLISVLLTTVLTCLIISTTADFDFKISQCQAKDKDGRPKTKFIKIRGSSKIQEVLVENTAAWAKVTLVTPKNIKVPCEETINGCHFDRNKNFTIIVQFSPFLRGTTKVEYSITANGFEDEPVISKYKAACNDRNIIDLTTKQPSTCPYGVNHTYEFSTYMEISNNLILRTDISEGSLGIKIAFYGESKTMGSIECHDEADTGSYALHVSED